MANIQEADVMELKIIAKQTTIPAFSPTVIQVKHINYYNYPYTSYEGDEITEIVIQKILEQIPKNINICLSLTPFGEDDWLEVISNGNWITLGYSSNHDGNYYSYNAAFADTEDLSPLESGGQSSIKKCFVLQDMIIGQKAVNYFIYTGKLYPGIDWAKQV